MISSSNLLMVMRSLTPFPPRLIQMVTSCSGVDLTCSFLNPFPRVNSPMWLHHSGLTMMHVKKGKFPTKFIQVAVLN